MTASIVASIASTSVGAGGSLLLASLANALPLPIVIPVHACVTFLGNISRWALLHEFVNYRVLLPFIGGTVIGVLLAAPLVGKLPLDAWQVVLGSFLLLATWWKPKGLNSQSHHYPWQCGLAASFLSVFVGATKPILVALFGQRFDEHKTVVATSNACATFPHIGKIILFSVIGGAFIEYWWLITILVIGSIVGSLIGKRLIIYARGESLRLIMKIVITALGINLLASGLGLAPWN